MSFVDERVSCELLFRNKKKWAIKLSNDRRILDTYCSLSWSSSILATWCEEPIHWKRPWCWERLRAKGEGGDRGWGGWIPSMNSMNLSLSKLQEIVKDRDVWCVAIHSVAKSQTRLSSWTTTTRAWMNTFFWKIFSEVSCSSYCCGLSRLLSEKPEVNNDFGKPVRSNKKTLLVKFSTPR